MARASQPSFAGRESEITFLGEQLANAAADRGSLVLVSGEAGIGKTRLADEFGKLASNKGFRVLVGRCIPGAPTPYLPFQDAFENYMTIETMPETGKELGIFRWVKGSSMDPRPETGSERTLHSTLEFLRKISAKQPILMILDDLQWADSASIQLLHFLARNCTGVRTLLMGTYRPEDLLIEEGGRVHPLLDSLRTMRREQICRELELDKLSVPELSSLIAGMLGGEVDDELLQKIASDSGGNPLFAVEAVQLLVQSKSIVSQGGKWRGIGSVRIDIPSTIREVILRRIDRLPKEERRVLETASVVGEWFEPMVLQEVLQLDKLHLLEVLDSIARNFRLLRTIEGGYRFAHEKVREVTYEQISLVRRKELHSIVARILESGLPDESLYAQLVLHASRAGELAKSLKYSLLAGENSLRRLAAREAIEYFQTAVELAKDDPSLLEQRLQALEGLGDSFTAAYLYDSALSSYESFLKLCQTPKDAARVLRKSSEIWLPRVKRDPTRASALLEQAERQSEIEKVEIGRIKKVRGNIAEFSRKFENAESYYLEAEKIFEETSSKEDLADVYLSQSHLYLSQGRGEEALQKARMGDTLLSGLKGPVGDLGASLMLSWVSANLGLYNDTFERSQKIKEWATRFGRPLAAAWADIHMAHLGLCNDDFESCRVEALKAKDEALKANSERLQAIANVYLCMSQIRLRNFEEGEKLCNEILERTETIDETDVEYLTIRAFAMLGLAELLAAREEWSASTENFEDSIQLFHQGFYSPNFEAIARSRFAEILVRQGLKPLAKQQFDEAIRLLKRLGNTAMARKVINLAEKAE